MRTRNVFAAVLVLVVAALAGPARAIEYTWDGVSGGDWNVPTNWDLDSGVPNAIGDVVNTPSADTVIELDMDAIIGTLSAGRVLTINSGTANTLTFDVASGRALIETVDLREIRINADVVLNDDILISCWQRGSVRFNGALTGSNDIYVAPVAGQYNTDRFPIGYGSDLSGFTGDIYLQAQTTADRYAIMSTRGLEATDLTSSIIYMGTNSRLDGVRIGGAGVVVAADIVLQDDANFWKDGNQGGFTTTGIISGVGGLRIATAAGGGNFIHIAGSAPNTFEGDVEIFSNGTSYGYCALDKDGALGTAPKAVTVSHATTLEITSSGGVEDRISNSSAVSLEVSTTYFGRLDLEAGVDETVSELWLDGVQQAAGTWGSTSSSAANQSNDYFLSGSTGILTVTVGAGAPAMNWDNDSDGGDGLWESTINWDAEGETTASLSVIVDNGDTVTLGVAGELAKNLDIGETTASSTLSISGTGTLDVNGLTGLGNNGLVTVHSNGTLTTEGTLNTDRLVTSGGTLSSGTTGTINVATSATLGAETITYEGGALGFTLTGTDLDDKTVARTVGIRGDTVTIGGTTVDMAATDLNVGASTTLLLEPVGGAATLGDLAMDNGVALTMEDFAGTTNLASISGGNLIDTGGSAIVTAGSVSPSNAGSPGTGSSVTILQEDRFTEADLASTNWSGAMVTLDTVNDQLDFYSPHDDGLASEWDLSPSSSGTEDGDTWTISFDVQFGAFDPTPDDPWMDMLFVGDGELMLEIQFKDTGTDMLINPRGDFVGEDANVIEGWSVDTWHHVDLVFNRSGSELVDYNGTQNLLDDQADLWVDGALGVHGFDIFSEGFLTGSDLDTVEFYARGGTDDMAEGILDNTVVSSGANVVAGSSIGKLAVENTLGTATVTIDTDGVLLTELTGNTTDENAKSDLLEVDGALTMTGAKIQLDWVAADAVEDGDYPTTGQDDAARAIAVASKFGGAYTIATASGSLTGTPTVNLLGNIGAAYVDSVDNTAGVLTVTLFDLGDGDTNIDGVVNSLDLSDFGQGWGSSSPTWANGDFNFDGVVNSLDLSDFGQAWGWSAASAGATGTNPVPEPGTIVMLLIGAAGVLLYRKRR